MVDIHGSVGDTTGSGADNHGMFKGFGGGIVVFCNCIEIGFIHG